ncbi:FKBP-type peptidyl-prolyl cis-trans isomerase [Aliidiomarina maris]|uniref:Peptidyl-prolyl cis-trans isomerase n=1 Tax=Aliidiomarina maris TaxID=531312 RepID=A0A327WZY5_9GAMM|nr:FKBP-type peptidyl-prolyl cis-trans isomerase [Aliidiomarina maris]MBA3988672.1 peptidylprolyl isomerase [Idiomarina sp.]MCL5049565.1 FKBP-type peptidyl-prolyl cis-trans isomerase [Bacillota bacterium]RAJ98286.1 FKBP-type peptidyl-prolyl cis-trans isomerase FkpA [Aliidiomarina maris]RUO24881.1 peptidylprolyl isomerase [Aliidiomarina maris]
MKTMQKVFAVSALTLALSACGNQAEQEVEIDFDDEIQRQSYALGASIGIYVEENLSYQQEAGVELDSDIIIRAFAESARGDSRMSQQEAEDILIALQEQVQRQRAEIVGGRAMSEGQEYLAENAERDNVVITESGLQYEIIREGEGERPASTDYVEVHYEGSLVNGDVFDSSYQRGEPAVFPLNRVIPGWTEGLQLMREGAHYRFVIPAELAYGEREVGGGRIPANSTLIFEVELLSIVGDDEE